MTPCSSGNSPTMPVTRSALREQRRPLRQRAVGARRAARSSRQPREAPHPLALAAELGVERDLRRAPARGSRAACLRSRSQKCRASAKRARSTRSLPATIAAPPSSASMLATKTKQWRQRARPRAEREIALVHPHRDLQHLGRQVHERGVDAAEHRHRPFDQARDFIEQAGVVAPRARPCSAASGGDAARR